MTDAGPVPPQRRLGPASTRHPAECHCWSCRVVGLWDAETGVGQVFSEGEELAAECRFHDCAHVAEPGCAVLVAVESGALPERRLDSYRKLLRENQRIVAKTDARLRADIRREWKKRREGSGGARGDGGEEGGRWM
jgi:ribosome biogenesis GTPase / thiamine phosphate phosphatase